MANYLNLLNNNEIMEGNNKFYVGLGILILFILGFIAYVGYTIAQSDTYQGFKEYDLDYETCMNQCTTPSVVETQQECENKCLKDYNERKGFD